MLNSQTPGSRQSSSAWHAHQQHQLQILQQQQQLQAGGTSAAAAFFATPRLPRRRRSLEDEDLQCRPRAVSIDSLMKSYMLALPGADKVSPKRFSTCSVSPTNLNRVDQRLQEGKSKN